MIAILVTIVICATLIYVIDRLHTNPIIFILHHKYEQILPPAKEPTAEEKKLIEEQTEQSSEKIDKISKKMQIISEQEKIQMNIQNGKA